MKNPPARYLASVRRSVRQFAWLFFFFAAASGAASAATTILVVGDSLSAGYGLPQHEAWPTLLERRLKGASPAGREYRVVNASISGETTAGGRSRLPALLERHRPGIVILELGANDGLRGLPLAAMRDNLADMLKLARRQGAQPILVGMRLPPNYGPYAGEFQQTFADLAKRTQTAFVPYLLDRLTQSPEHFQADGLHPTRAAQGIVLDNVWPTLQSLLR